MHKFKRKYLVSLLPTLFAAIAVQGQNKVIVEVQAFENQNGYLLAGLYNEEVLFLKKPIKVQLPK